MSKKRRQYSAEFKVLNVKYKVLNVKYIELSSERLGLILSGEEVYPILNTPSQIGTMRALIWKAYVSS